MDTQPLLTFTFDHLATLGAAPYTAGIPITLPEKRCVKHVDYYRETAELHEDVFFEDIQFNWWCSREQYAIAAAWMCRKHLGISCVGNLMRSPAVVNAICTLHDVHVMPLKQPVKELLSTGTPLDQFNTIMKASPTVAPVLKNVITNAKTALELKNDCIMSHCCHVVHNEPVAKLIMEYAAEFDHSRVTRRRGFIAKRDRLIGSIQSIHDYKFKAIKKIRTEHEKTQLKRRADTAIFQVSNAIRGCTHELGILERR